MITIESRNKAAELKKLAYGERPFENLFRFAELLKDIDGHYYKHTLFSLETKGANTLYGSPQVIARADGKHTVVFLASSREESAAFDLQEDERIASEAMQNIAGEIEARIMLEDAARRENRTMARKAEEIEKANERNKK